MKDRELDAGGAYLRPEDREEIGRQKAAQNRRRLRRVRWTLLLLCWDGFLLYMIVECLIEPVYGAIFVAVISVCAGCHLK